MKAESCLWKKESCHVSCDESTCISEGSACRVRQWRRAERLRAQTRSCAYGVATYGCAARAYRSAAYGDQHSSSAYGRAADIGAPHGYPTDRHRDSADGNRHRRDDRAQSCRAGSGRDRRLSGGR